MEAPLSTMMKFMDATILCLALLSVPGRHPDLDRFPSLSQVQDMLRFNMRYQKNVQNWKAWEAAQGVGYWQAVLNECRELREPWVVLEDVLEATDGDVRAWWLWRLRELLGDDDYFAGRMPVMVPVWRFRTGS